jgi:hypothetical protein
VKAENLVQEALRLCGLLGEIEGRFVVLANLLRCGPRGGCADAPPIVSPVTERAVLGGLARVGEELQSLAHLLEERRPEGGVGAVMNDVKRWAK